MSLQELGIIHKKIDKIYVGYTNFRGEISDIPSKIDEFYKKIKDYTSSPAIAVIDYGVYSEGGKNIDICYPIKEFEEINEIKTKYLEPIEVLSIIHQGSYENLLDTFQKLIKFVTEHVVLGTALRRFVYHKYNQKNPDDNQIEIQYNLHKWDDKLAKSIDNILGEKVRKDIMKDREELFNIESSYDNRIQWLKDMLDRLDKITNEDQKYEIISRCAHEFSSKRIEYMRKIYERTGDINRVIEEMHKDNVWYEKPILKNNILYVSKIPADQEGYEKAETIEEKKRNYCHCRFINENLNKGISPSFCYCGTGWYRQQWEGILGKSVKVNILKSLLKGDDKCQVAIYLPSDI
jgi:effector-binding domain-containing protein